MQVIKRDLTTQEFDESKIIHAIEMAFKDVEGEIKPEATKKATEIAQFIHSRKEDMSVETIQDLVEDKLMASSRKDVARAYIRYRYKKEVLRRENTTDRAVMELLTGESDYWNNENSNKNAVWLTTQRDYLAGITSTDIARRFLFPKAVIDAHDKGVIHVHDMDYMAENTRTNCCLINLEDMLQNGTVINGVMIEKPHRFLTAMTIATQIITAVASSQYGGTTITLTHLAPFVRSSYEEYYKKYRKRHMLPRKAKKYALEDVKKEIKDGVQTFNYQVNSMSTTNGQTPFLSVCMYLNETTKYKDELAMIIEEFLHQRILGFKNEKGVYITPAFPKLLYFLEEDNIKEGSKYWYLTELAAKCTAKRMVPDYISEKKMLEFKGEAYPCMGCRSFLTPDVTTENLANALNYSAEKGKYYGRFNCGVFTLNLVDAALSAHNEDEFWRLLDVRAELCHIAMQTRIERLSKTTSDVAPILWQHGAFARLNPGDTLDKLVHNQYATISLGYAGLYECTKYMTGYSHTDPIGKEFALKVMQRLNDYCSKWKEEENVAYSVYGTPIESTTYKFAKKLKERFGNDVFIKIDGNDRNYITNSYHVTPKEEIGIFEKLDLEAEFQKLSPGGMISYGECADMTKNIPAVLEVIKHIYNNTMYAELNTKSDYCQICGYNGEIEMIDKNNTLIWHCPNCGNENQNKINIARRVCGYISTNSMNQGRMNDIKDRYVHLDNREDK